MTDRRGSSAVTRAQWRDRYACTPYDQLPWFDPQATPALVHSVKERFLSPPAVVLDIGCGAGSNLLWLARRGFRAHGVDLAPGAVSAARERASKAGLVIEVRTADALDLPYPRSHFDGVLDHGCFHTLPIRRRREYAAEVARVLRPEGAYLLAWVAREYQGQLGPPHRPSLGEVTGLFERAFLFERTDFRPGSEADGLASYAARMRRRTRPQPPPR
ncbi:MAG: class I SAM-dependent methyltransferase [Thermoplasmata archaeon]|nr:class I SAM-dependent methyltransferase [Thermoplasmata archaeon]